MVDLGYLLVILVILWVLQLLESQVFLVGPRKASFYQDQKSTTVSQGKRNYMSTRIAQECS